MVCLGLGMNSVLWFWCRFTISYCRFPDVVNRCKSVEKSRSIDEIDELISADDKTIEHDCVVDDLDYGSEVIEGGTIGIIDLIMTFRN